MDIFLKYFFTSSTMFKHNFFPQIRLSEVSGLEVADRRGYLTLELETGKDGVLLLR